MLELLDTNMQTNKRKEIKGRKEKERKEMRDLDIDIILRKKKKTSKWIVELHLKCKTVKHLENNKWETLDVLEDDGESLDTELQIKFMNTVINKLAFIKN